MHVLKEIVDAYRALNGSIFACYLDASKAFDRVTHRVLFEKLVRRGVPGYIVRILYLNMYGEKIQEVTKTKYLGHIITNDLTDDADIDRQVKKLYAQGNSILRKFHMCSWDVKLTLFRAYCSPLYTAQLWWSHKRASINRLKVTYHNLFKMFLGLPKYESTSLLCTALDVHCCQAVIRRLIYSFMVRLAATKNSIITVMYGTQQASRIRKHWLHLLHTSSG